MDRQMVETYRYLRDNAKPCSQQDAADLAKLRAPQPPSKALLARIKRHEQNRPFVEPYVAPKPRSAQSIQSEIQREFHKRVLAQLGGTPTVEPAPQSKPRAYLNVVKSDGFSPFPASKEERIDSEKRALNQRRVVALATKVYDREYEPDMFEILDTFGNFPKYKEALK